MAQLTAEDVIREALEREMSDISENEWCAGWLIGLEFILWRALQSPDGGGFTADLGRLRQLSELAGGWWIRDRGEEQRFVTLEEWIPMFEDHERNPPQ